MSTISNVEPRVIEAILLSDAIIREERTGKLSLIGCFTKITCPAFPFQLPKFYVTALISNLKPRTKSFKVTFRLESADGSQVFQSASGSIQFHDANSSEDSDVFEICQIIPSCVVTSPGLLQLVVLVNNTVAGKRLLPVRNLTIS